MEKPNKCHWIQKQSFRYFSNYDKKRIPLFYQRIHGQ